MLRAEIPEQSRNVGSDGAPDDVVMPTVRWGFYHFDVHAITDTHAPQRSKTAPSSVSIETASSERDRIASKPRDDTDVPDELRQMTLKGLKQRAAEFGLSKEIVDAVDDHDEPKEELIRLVLAKQAAKPRHDTDVPDELRRMTLKGLKKRAAELGFSKEIVDAVDDHDEPKEELIRQILAKQATERRPDTDVLDELRQMTLKGLKERAAGLGFSKEIVDAVDDHDEPKEELIRQILAKQTGNQWCPHHPQPEDQPRNHESLPEAGEEPGACGPMLHYSRGCGIHRLCWSVHGKRLSENESRIVSGEFRIPVRGRNMPFKMVINPVFSTDGRGGASFKRARGRGKIFLKCEDVFEGDDPAMLKYQISVRSGAEDPTRQQGPRGPLVHDFASVALSGFATTEDEWDLMASVDPNSDVFVVILEIFDDVAK